MSSMLTVGLGGTERVSSRVLKPPGGGCADIFGVDEPERRAPPRHSHATSSICLGDYMPPARAPAAVPDTVADTQPTAPPAEPAPEAEPAAEAEDEEQSPETESADGSEAAFSDAAEPSPADGEEPEASPAGGEPPPAPPAAAAADQPPKKEMHTFTRVRQPPGGHSTPFW